SLKEIKQEVQRPIVKALIKLLEFRNKEKAFDLQGSIKVLTPSDHEIVITRTNKQKTSEVTAKVDFENLTYFVTKNKKKITF
ncbi:MAG: sucrose phosphorylase, partial [Lactobacillus sp.]|nr:sucrose phosphorylase [Lactobacillus sp.]